MAKWTTQTRKEYKKTHPENFAGPGTSYPIKDAADVKNAWNLAGHAGFPDRVRGKIKKIAKRLGLSAHLPSTAKAAMASNQMSTEELAYFHEAVFDSSPSDIVSFMLPEGWTIETLRSQIQDAVEDKYQESGKTGDDGNWISGCWPWLRDFDEDYCYYSLRGSDVYRESWSLDGTEVALGSDQTKVLLLPEYIESSDQTPDAAEGTEYMSGGYSIATLPVVGFDDGFVTRAGKVFEVGIYPDKDFSITVEEMQAAIAAFKPLPNKGAHVPTIFDGKMGTLESLSLADDGKTVNGTIKIPKWMNDLHGPTSPLQASLEFHRGTKQVVGNTLIPNPRVGDSALMAAFSSAQEESKSPNHLIESIKQLLGFESTVGFTPKEEPVAETPNTPSVMTFSAEQVQAMQAQIATLTQENQRVRAQARVGELAAWVIPAQVPALTAVFQRAVALDEQGGAVVAFSDAKGEEKKVSFADAIVEAIKSGPQHNLTAETVTNTALFALPVTRTDPPQDEAKQAATSITEWAKKQGITKEGTGS